MFVLFDDSGVFRTGTILADNDASLQVETSHGKRIKLKRGNVLLQFNAPEASVMLTRAEEEAGKLDHAFLWEVCSDDEFAFADFAHEYYGHIPTVIESVAVLLCLHAEPVYFHRKGHGRFRRATPEILQAALAGLEKKRLQTELMENMRETLVRGIIPPALAQLLPQALYKPDRNRIEIKALEAASVDTGQTPARLLLKCGAFASSYDYHLNRFLFENFPEGIDFPSIDFVAPSVDAPEAGVRAFSIDDASTTEIDDAFSVTPAAGGGWKVGIHIAIPGLGFSRDSACDQIVRNRLSTVYFPGQKFTMLPPQIMACYTLEQGHTLPALSLYLDVNAALTITGMQTCIDKVPIVANLRIHELEKQFNEHSLAQEDVSSYAWQEELTLLWRLATVLEAGRGKTNQSQNQTDYLFDIDWEQITPDGKGFATISQRQRGSPIDRLVSELMILVNATWGKMLDDAGIPGLYRVQQGGKVRMSTAAQSHEALGVDFYAWSSSPLRRYVDLVNQWQLISIVQKEPATFAPKSLELQGILRDFELTYTAYGEFQRLMERYWCLRYLRQTQQEFVEAVCLRDNMVRLLSLPLITKVKAMPPVLPGSRVKLKIEGSDLLDVEIDLRYVATLAESEAPIEAENNFFESKSS